MLTSLPPERQCRVARMRHPADRWRAVIGGHLLRWLYQSWAGPGPIPRLRLGPRGKPAFDAPNAPEVNISHSGDWVVGAVGAEPLGIDVEGHVADPPVLSTVLSAQEQHDLARLPQGARVHRFTVLWTLKEAIIKARGETLSDSLRDLCIGFDPDHAPILRDGNAPRSLHWGTLDARHVYAVASTTPIVPMDRYDATEFLCACTSGLYQMR